MATEITLPASGWRPRPYQVPLWTYLERGGKRAYEVAHRRWGKDDVCLHWTACAAAQRAGNYWHMLPEAAQARKAIWDAINPHTGKRRIDEAFPYALRRRTVDNEMKIEFVNGAIWQVLGSDNYNSYVGSPPVGVVLSEWALGDPQCWAYIEPILEENGGWALFITTPRGRNHAATFYEMAKDFEGWFAEKQGVKDTGVFGEEQLAKVRAGLIRLYGEDEGAAKFDQEYHVSFNAALPGAYFGREMNAAENAGRISGVPHTPGILVYPCFDFGRGQSNSTAITFMQLVGREPRAIDYFEDSAGRIDAFGKMLKDRAKEFGYDYGSLILPHDAGHDRLATGMSYAAQFEAMGFETAVLTVTPEKKSDISLALQFIEMCWFDEKKCGRLVEALRSYHREFDHATKAFRPTPKHDWSSHGADSYMAAAVAHKAGYFVAARPKKSDMSDVPPPPQDWEDF